MPPTVANINNLNLINQQNNKIISGNNTLAVPENGLKDSRKNSIITTVSGFVGDNENKKIPFDKKIDTIDTIDRDDNSYIAQRQNDN